MTFLGVNTSDTFEDVKKLIPFDPEGIIGPALTLAFEAHTYSEDLLAKVALYVESLKNWQELNWMQEKSFVPR